MSNVRWVDWEDIVNDHFLPLVNIDDRYVICYGSRGSSKTSFVIDQLIYNCINHTFFRCMMIRKEKVTVRHSCYSGVEERIRALGLDSLFQFKKSTLEIICANGNKFVGMGADEPKKIKSFTDPTCAWWEEDIPDEDSFITITTSIRTPKGDKLQEFFSINPEIEGEDYTENWFFQKFFEEWYPGNLHHKGVTVTEEVSKFTGKLLRHEDKYTVHHSDYTHNVWLPSAFGRELEKLSETNPFYYQVYAKGLWGRKDVKNRFYRSFSLSKHTNFPCKYDPEEPLHISFDFNVNPYVSIGIYQIKGKLVRIIDEIAAKDPHNTTEEACKIFHTKYLDHRAGLFVYGDPSGRKEDTSREKGHNDYRIIMRTLATLRPQRRVARKAPSVSMRGQWIDAIFHHMEGGIKVEIGDKAKYHVTDFMECRAKPDGTKHKMNVVDNGVRYEKFGHHSDAFDYFMCMAFQDDWNRFRNFIPDKRDRQRREAINVKDGYYPSIIER